METKKLHPDSCCDSFLFAKELMTLIRKTKTEAGKNMKWPVEKMTVEIPCVGSLSSFLSCKDDVMKAGNVKSFSIVITNTLDNCVKR